MEEKICFNKTIFISLFIVFLLIIILCHLFLFIRQQNVSNIHQGILQGPLPEKSQPITETYQKTLPKILPPLSHPTVFNVQPDIIRDYDYNKIDDPLEEPTRRVARHELHPYFLKKMIDIPTRGYPDNFIQLGTLTKKGDPNKNPDNQLLRLFGRQEYPGSYRYEYYTMVNSGNDQIKVPVDTRNRKELFDGDRVYIKELDDLYEIHLHKFDAPKYYPDIIL